MSSMINVEMGSNNALRMSGLQSIAAGQLSDSYFIGFESVSSSEGGNSAWRAERRVPCLYRLERRVPCPVPIYLQSGFATWEADRHGKYLGYLMSIAGLVRGHIRASELGVCRRATACGFVLGERESAPGGKKYDVIV